MTSTQNRWFAGALAHPRWLAVGCALVVGCGTGMLVGPVGGCCCAAYSATVVAMVSRRAQRRRVAAVEAAALDAVAGLVADLRAGLAPAAALAGAVPAIDAADWSREASLATRVAAAWEVAELTGAPLADLLERVEIDARVRGRIREQAAAEAAGANATAWLLAALPLGGIGLGYGIGADPLAALLHTRLGAFCAIGALSLQLAGGCWADRLTRRADRLT